MNQDIIKTALDSIAINDAELATALADIGYPEPRIRPTGFATFFNIIVSQQLSTKVAATIMQRARDLLPELNAHTVLALPDGALREIGLSGRKVEYVSGLAEAIINGEFSPEALDDMDDDAVREAIIALRGFGPWSAEIYLMFSLQRTDIFPSGDLALLIGLKNLKQLAEKPTPQQAQALVAHWSPWRSVGSLFLWHYYNAKPL